MGGEDQKMKETEAAAAPKPVEKWPGTKKALDDTLKVVQSLSRAIRSLEDAIKLGRVSLSKVKEPKNRKLFEAHFKEMEKGVEIKKKELAGLRDRYFLEAAKGLEKPDKIFRTHEDAAKFVESRRKEFEGVVAKAGIKLYDMGKLPEISERDRDFLGMYVKEGSDWVKGFLPSKIRERFERTPLVVMIGNSKYFMQISQVSGGVTGGIYLPGTNVIALPDYMVSRDFSGMRTHIVVHENLHYAAFLGGGNIFRWRDEKGAPVVRGYISWFHEGLTELHAQQITYQNSSGGAAPVAYPRETEFSFLLQTLVGKDTLKEAYFSGDLTKVRQAVDEKLGPGTFDALISKKRGTEALALLSDKIKAAGMNPDSLMEKWKISRGV